MLFAFPKKSCEITRVYREEDRLYLKSERGILRLEPKTDCTVRITYTVRENFSEVQKPGVVLKAALADWSYEENEEQILLKTKNLKLVICKKTASISYYNAEGKHLLSEKETDSRSMEEFQSYKLADNAETKIEKIQTADGVKEVVREAIKVPDKKLFHTRLDLVFAEGEGLYGLGQHEEGFENLRGEKVYVHQANRKIAVPVLVSDLGYGILTDTYSPMIFNDTRYGTYIYTEADEEMDYYFMYGGSMDGVVSQYRKLTGKAAMLPKWAFGYVQSQERYETALEMENTVAEFRKRKIGLDAIVLDWLSWPDNLWGQKTFDPGRFQSPKEMIENLHKENVHFMISIWPTMDEKSDNYREFKEQNLLLPGSNVYNALSKEGRDLYWKQVNEGLFRYGVDSWWCDSSEPYTPEWNHTERMDAANQYAEYCKTSQNHLPTEAMNPFGLYQAISLYEGQRGQQDKENIPIKEQKRVVNLTRSSYTGQQRYGTILWSGDTDASWDTLKKQIRAGLHFCISGLPYWTVDIGAFFVRNGVQWYWQGNYPKANEDLGYRELFTRWFQWGAFLPVFRGHGSDCRREPWHYGDQGDMFYDSMVAFNKLRYRLMPYIYSQAGRVWLEDTSMMKLMAAAFPEDEKAKGIWEQYLFGDSILVCPVTEPMYYEADSRELVNVEKTKEVYLPAGFGWYDYWTKEYYEGGQTVKAVATIDRMPLFVKAGSVIPISDCYDYSCITPCAYEVYSGADASFTLYEDDGDGYAYEQGEYTLTKLLWKDSERKLFSQKGEEVQSDKIIIY